MSPLSPLGGQGWGFSSSLAPLGGERAGERGTRVAVNFQLRLLHLAVRPRPQPHGGAAGRAHLAAGPGERARLALHVGRIGEGQLHVAGDGLALLHRGGRRAEEEAAPAAHHRRRSQRQRQQVDQHHPRQRRPGEPRRPGRHRARQVEPAGALGRAQRVLLHQGRAVARGLTPATIRALLTLLRGRRVAQLRGDCRSRLHWKYRPRLGGLTVRLAGQLLPQLHGREEVAPQRGKGLAQRPSHHLRRRGAPRQGKGRPGERGHGRDPRQGQRGVARPHGEQ